MRCAALLLAALVLGLTGCKSIYEVEIEDELQRPGSDIHDPPGLFIHGYETRDGLRQTGTGYVLRRLDGNLEIRLGPPFLDGDLGCVVLRADDVNLPYSWRRAAPHGILSRIERVGRFQDVCLLASRVVGEAAWVRARSAQESTLDGSATSSDAAIARDGRPQSCEPMNKAG